MMKWVAAALILIASGCTSAIKNGDAQPPPTVQSATILSRHFSGDMVYRIPLGTGPGMYSREGSFDFCVNVPSNTTELRAFFFWERAQEMVLEYHAPGSFVPTHSVHGSAPPLILSAKDPPAGSWLIYGGPAIAGGVTRWNMTVTWTIAGVATVEDTIDPHENDCDYQFPGISK